MYVRRETVSLTTNGSGAATGYTGVVTGRVLGVIYTKTDFSDGVDITITAEATGEAILTLSNQNSSGTFYPRVAVHGGDGTALTYDSSEPVSEPVAVAQDRIKIDVASGGSGKTGTVAVIIG